MEYVLKQINQETRVINLDVDPLVDPDICCDWSNPALRGKKKRYKVVTGSIQFNLSDVHAPLMVEAGKEFVCIHCAGDYLINMPPYYRKAWWEKTKAKYFVEIIDNLPLVKGRPVRRCQFLCIFKTKEAYNTYWMKEPKYSSSVPSVVPQWGQKCRRTV